MLRNLCLIPFVFKMEVFMKKAILAISIVAGVLCGAAGVSWAEDTPAVTASNPLSWIFDVLPCWDCASLVTTER